MQKNSSVFSKTQTITAVAMLTALSVIIGIVCKNFFTFNVYYRVTFENLPIILAGITFGPFYGAACGICADLLSCLCSSNPAVIPLITLGAAAVGFCSGAVPRYIFRKRGGVQYSFAVASAHIIGQVIIKSIAKILWLGMPTVGAFIGLGVSLVVGTVEFFAILFIMRRGILPVQRKK
ncbi:MAG: folate family ECF transporter S component [Clostridia bacterium]|nr:folate family ECF transporter S component [Clostridia bacterium]